MSILDSIFGKRSNPMDEANKYLGQIPGTGHEFYDPYINQGRGASNRLGSEYENMLNDPTGFIDNIMKNYKTSEGYNFQKDQLTKELGNTAAAGGIAGTPLDQMNQGKGIQGLLSQDMQQYLQNALGIHTQGLGGEEGIANKGFGASGSLADLLGNALNQQGGLAFQNSQQNNSNRSAMISALVKALGGAAGAFGNPFGGGLAGPMSGGGGSPWNNPG